MKTTQTIGIVGAGTMGSGIAHACALSGLSVVTVDLDWDRIGRGREAVASSLERLVRRGSVTEPERDAALGRLFGTTQYETLQDCDFVIEAASEDAALKIKILRKVDEIVSPEAVVATNTSSISISALGAAMRRPARFLGVHFFNPVPVMALVEVVRGRQTGEPALEAAVRLAERLGKTPVVVQDAPGFVVNRLLCPMLNEAVLAYAEGVASAQDIDQAMKLGCNHPIGPLALADLIGLDVLLAVMETFHREFKDPKYRPAPLLRQMVATGRLGHKSGQGFHTYRNSI